MNARVFVVFLVALGIIAAVVFLPRLFGDSTDGPVACTLEAKLCPDGSAVGRTGPNCEFAACPTDEEMSGWETTTDQESGVTFRYPDIQMTYVHATDWPPIVRLESGPYNCLAAGSPTARAGRTEPRTIFNREYCVTEVVGAAAGSTYRQFAYATELPYRASGEVVYLTFTFQYPQCANFDAANQSACREEQERFDIDRQTALIVSTITEARNE